jgi:hypothetical protein
MNDYDIEFMIYSLNKLLKEKVVKVVYHNGVISLIETEKALKRRMAWQK